MMDISENYELESIKLEDFDDRFEFSLLQIDDSWIVCTKSELINGQEDLTVKIFLLYSDLYEKFNIYIHPTLLERLKNISPNIADFEQIFLEVQEKEDDDGFTDIYVKDFFVDEVNDIESNSYYDEPIESNDEWIENNFDEDDISTVFGNLD